MHVGTFLCTSLVAALQPLADIHTTTVKENSCVQSGRIHSASLRLLGYCWQNLSSSLDQFNVFRKLNKSVSDGTPKLVPGEAIHVAKRRCAPLIGCSCVAEPEQDSLTALAGLNQLLRDGSFRHEHEAISQEQFIGDCSSSLLIWCL
jgi:hypothetical protein